jgi:hypothetical protein
LLNQMLGLCPAIVKHLGWRRFHCNKTVREAEGNLDEAIHGEAEAGESLTRAEWSPARRLETLRSSPDHVFALWNT